MAIELQCPGCAQKLRVPDDAAGKSAKCPKCATLVQIPGGAAPPPPEIPPAWSFGDVPSKPADPYAPAAPVNPYASPQPLAGKPMPGFATPGVIGHQQVGVEHVLNYAIKIWQANLGLLAGTSFTVIAITYAFAFVTGILQGILEQNDQPELALTVALFANIISNVLQIFLGIGQAQISLKLARQQPAEFSDLFNGGSRFLPVLGGSILAGLAVTLGVLLCVVPGIILCLYYWPFYFLIVDDRAPVLDSFRIAGNITEHNRTTTFLIWLLSVGIGALGCLALCIGIIFAAPLVSLLWAVAYLMMSGQLATEPGVSKYMA